MKILFKIFNVLTNFELFFLKNKFKEYGTNVKIGYLPTISNPNYITLKNDIVIGNNATLYAINNDLFFDTTPNLSIGSNVYIGHNVAIHCMNSVILENNVVLSDNIYISDVSHGTNLDLADSIMKQKWISPGPVKIGKGTFLGHAVKVLPNVSIGNNCIVAAGSIVTKSFPPFCVLAGSPAKIIKKYCFEKNNWRKTDHEGNFKD